MRYNGKARNPYNAGPYNAMNPYLAFSRKKRTPVASDDGKPGEATEGDGEASPETEAQDGSE
jgi:hypothetical protein